MPETMTTTLTSTQDSVAYTQSVAVTADNIHRSRPSVAVAKIGTLTTRTDNDTGTLTMSSGHGFTDGVKVDVFWAGSTPGRRRNMTVGTVSTNSVPVDGGSGDSLPTNNTAVTAMVANTETLSVAGDNVSGIVVSSPVAGFVTFAQSNDTVIKSYTFTGSGSYSWVDGIGATNPLAGVTVGKILFSHGDSGAARTMTAILLHS